VQHILHLTEATGELPDMDVGWIHPWVGLGWVGLGWVENFPVLVGWVGLGLFTQIVIFL